MTTQSLRMGRSMLCFALDLLLQSKHQACPCYHCCSPWHALAGWAVFPTSFPGTDVIEGRERQSEAQGEAQPPPVATLVPEGFDQEPPTASGGCAPP